MVINSMFVNYLVDTELKVEIIFRKKGTAENGGGEGVDIEIVGIDTSAH